MGKFVQVNVNSSLARARPIGYRVKANGCWDWVGATNPGGYGHWYSKSGTCLAHRRVYEMHKGPIPAGLTLDHLCRRPICVNPDHLEPVTQYENWRRGDAPAAKRVRQKAREHQRRGIVISEEE